MVAIATVYVVDSLELAVISFYFVTSRSFVENLGCIIFMSNRYD